MSYMDWKDKTAEFKKIDVRGIAGNFLEMGKGKVEIAYGLLIRLEFLEIWNF